MSAKYKHDLCVAVRKYTDADGKEKNQWQKVGVELETDSGGRIILLDRWFNPAGLPDPENRGTVMLSLFDPKGDKQSAPTSKPASTPAAKAPGADEFKDDIPF